MLIFWVFVVIKIKCFFKFCCETHSETESIEHSFFDGSFRNIHFHFIYMKKFIHILCSVSGEWGVCIYGFRFLLCCYIDNGQSIFLIFLLGDSCPVRIGSDIICAIRNTIYLEYKWNVDDDDGLPMVSVLWYLNKSSDWLFGIIFLSSHTHT